MQILSGKLALEKMVETVKTEYMVKTGKKALGTERIARICQVTRHTVARWIKEGKLPSFDTGGGQKRVWAADLIVFLTGHRIPIPTELSISRYPKILIVDDEPSVRRLISRLLCGLCPNAEIQEAVDGFEAGKKIAEFLPSMVILDLKLPGIDGVRVCRSIRSDERLKKIIVLAMSGLNAKRAALEAGADDFLAKPFEGPRFAEKLNKFLPRPNNVELRR